MQSQYTSGHFSAQWEFVHSGLLVVRAYAIRWIYGKLLIKETPCKYKSELAHWLVWH